MPTVGAGKPTAARVRFAAGDVRVVEAAPRRSRVRQAGNVLGHHLATVGRIARASASLDIQVHPILGGLTLGNRLKVEPRPQPVRVHRSRPPLLRRNLVLPRVLIPAIKPWWRRLKLLHGVFQLPRGMLRTSPGEITLGTNLPPNPPPPRGQKPVSRLNQRLENR